MTGTTRIESGGAVAQPPIEPYQTGMLDTGRAAGRPPSPG
jgi:hypothetical protein